MPAPTQQAVYRVQCELASEGQLAAPIGSTAAYYAACRELGRRGGRARARRRNPFSHTPPRHSHVSLSLPPRDRE